MNIKKVTGYDLDDMLRLMGLARRRSIVDAVLPVLGYIALGTAIGAGVGLLLAPSSGRRLRQDVGDRLDQILERVKREGRSSVAEANAPH
jgi:hypothetical protein